MKLVICGKGSRLPAIDLHQNNLLLKDDIPMNDPLPESTVLENDIWPKEIRLSKNKNQLDVDFDNGDQVSLTAELLRVESPSAEVQGHGSGQKTTPPGKQNILISTIEPVGNYAIRIRFSDGHDTGIFSWKLLHDYGRQKQDLMADYLSRLENAGMSRS